MLDAASTCTKPDVMYIALPWHRSGCRTVRPEDVRFPSSCCSVSGCGCGCAWVCSWCGSLWSPRSPLLSVSRRQPITSRGLDAVDDVLQHRVFFRHKADSAFTSKHTHLPHNLEWFDEYVSFISVSLYVFPPASFLQRAAGLYNIRLFIWRYKQ